MPRAMLVYGTALFNGDGVPQDPVLGYAYVSRAAAQGLEPARNTLAADGRDHAARAAQEGRRHGDAEGEDPAAGHSRSPPRRLDRKLQKPPSPATRAEGCSCDKRRLADPARRFLAAIVGGGPVQAAIGQRTRRGPPAIPGRGGVRHPAPGRPLPQQGGSGGCVQQPVREGTGLLPGRGEIVR